MVGDGTASQIPPTNGAAAPLLDLTDRAFWIGLVVVVLSVVSALATYLILTGLTPIAPRDDVVLGALLINVVLIIAMIAVIAWQFYGMWQAWRAKLPGARLHVRIVLLFSITAAVPAMLLAVAATTTFSRSLDSWFSTRTRAIINNSVEVAQAYVEEHGQLLRTDIANMVRDIDAAADHTAVDSPQFKQQIIAQAGLRDLPVAYVLDGQAKRVISALEDAKLPFTSVPLYYVKQAETGQVALFTPNDTSQVSALAKLNRYPDRFLYVSRVLSAKVMGHLQQTERRRVQLASARARRPQAGARPHLHDDLDDGSACRDLGGVVVREPVRGSYPAPHRSGAAGFARQSRGRIAGAARRGRSSPPLDDFQHHDARAQASA
jgi:two-component system nitrogen regulation sensor histidine kinase NtrY